MGCGGPCGPERARESPRGRPEPGADIEHADRAVERQGPRRHELSHRRRALRYVTGEGEAQPRRAALARVPERARAGSLYAADSSATRAASLATSPLVGHPRDRATASSESRQSSSRGRTSASLAVLSSSGFFIRRYHRRVPASPQAEPRLVVAAGAVVFDGLGRVLLVRRGHAPSLGEWTLLPGGRVEPGESPEAAVVRELREETALDGRVIASLGVVAVVGAGVRWLDSRVPRRAPTR